MGTRAFHLNFMQQMRLLHALLPTRSRSVQREPTVLFFAGGGVNNAVQNYSSYTIAKIALILKCANF